MGLPLQATGALVVAWDDHELSKLPDIVSRARNNGISGVRLLSTAELLSREPCLNRSALGGILVPGEAVIDPWSAPLAYAFHALANGGRIIRGATVTAGELRDSVWRLQTSAGAISANIAINCAGNHGDFVEAIARPSPFQIRPRKGQFVVYDKPACGLVKAIILPVPNERTKGVVISRTAYGNLLVGPTAEDQEDRCVAAVDEPVLRALVERGQFLLPGLGDYPITATYAGLRPATQFKDYQIEAVRDRRWITVSGIRSTGLSGALGISSYVRSLYEECFTRHKPLVEVKSVTVPNLAEGSRRPYMEAGRTEIVCHCEWVTAKEIEDALSGPLPARTVGGLKRRTRCMMGRCQGFYCIPRVIELAKGRLQELPGTRSDHAGQHT
jgi:glycerol-3-phosphate dehydrogenase